MSAPTKELVESIYRGKLEQAAQMTPGERLFSGPELFDLASEFTKAGIRMQRPGIDEREVMRLFVERLKLGRRLEKEL